MGKHNRRFGDRLCQIRIRAIGRDGRQLDVSAHINPLADGYPDTAEQFPDVPNELVLLESLSAYLRDQYGPDPDAQPQPAIAEADERS